MERVYDLFNSLWKKIMQLSYWPLLVLRIIFFPLSKLTFVVFILLLGYYAICINDQGQDMMAVFTAKSIFDDNLYLAFFQLFILFWAIATWNVARILLSAANLTSIIKSEVNAGRLEKLGIDKLIDRKQMTVVYVDSTYQKWLRVASDWIPRLLALVPYIIFFIGYQKQAKTFHAIHPWNTIIMGSIAILHFLYVCFRRKISARLFHRGPAFFDTGVKALEEEKNLYQAVKKSRVMWNTGLTILMVIIMFIYAKWAADDDPGLNGKPGLIVITGLTFYTLVGLLINYTTNRVKLPLFLIAVLVATLIFFNWNNNHSIQTLTGETDRALLEKRTTDMAYADKWLAKKFPDTSDTKTKTVFIVAAEGGGIRNCYWTYSVLNKLQKEKPEFFDRTFAVTGVSGGSIGLGFYYNFRYYVDKHDKTLTMGTPAYDLKLDTISRSDYLSRVTYGFLFPDLFQRFLPFPVDSWDRSKMLANSFDDGFSHSLNQKSVLSQNYLSMWSDTADAYKYPVVLYNTILNENGMKGVFSPYSLSDTYYPDVMDILGEINQSVPTKEAMTSSARFPLLTAPGLLQRYDPKEEKVIGRIGHISDGGGFENTAIQTAQQTARLLGDRYKANGYKGKLSVRVIYIGTGVSYIETDDGSPARQKKYGTSINRAYEIAWLYGGVKTIFGWMKSSHNQHIRINPDYRLLQFSLIIKEGEDEHQLPLGWFLSDPSRAIIQNQLSNKKKNLLVDSSFQIFKAIDLKS